MIASVPASPDTGAEKEIPPRPVLPFASWFLGIIISAIATFPLEIRRWLGRWGGRFFSLIPTPERTVAQLQFNKILARYISPPSIREVYENIGIMALETLNLAPIIADIDSYVHCPNLDLVHAIRAKKVPVLALTGHASNWDLLGAYIIAKGIPVTTVGREARISLFQEIVRRVRSLYGITTIWRSDRLAIRALMEAFRRKEVVAALIDQDTYVQSLMIPFLGIPARTPSTLVELGKRSEAIIVSAFLFREQTGKYTAYIEEIDAHLPVEDILLEYNKRLGDYLCRYPSQWVWFHKRWRSQTLSTRMRTKEYIQFLTDLP